MSGLPYVRDDGGDPSSIPLNRLRAPARNPSSQSITSTSDPEPPAHHVHPHGFSSDHYYQGIDPGYQPDAGDQTDEETSGAGYSSGHKSKSSNPHDATLVEREKQAFMAEHSEKQQDHHHHHHHKHHKRDPDSKDVSESEDESDDFDWDTSDEEDNGGEGADTKRIRAKRGRKAYLALMRLARPVRLFVVGLLGTAIALVPFIVVLAAFRSNPVRPQVYTWSIWVAIVWAASCGTFLVLDFVPPIVLKLGVAFWGKAPETFKTYVEVLIAILIYIKLVLCISWAWISLSGVLAIEYSSTNQSQPPYFRWIFRIIQALFGTSIILLAEKSCLQLIAINFHKTALKDRLENNKSALKALDALHDSKYLASGYNSRRQTGMFHFGMGSGSRPGTPKAFGGNGFFNGSPKDKEKKENATPANDKEARKTNFANQLSDALATATMKNSKLYRGKGSKSQLSARRLAKKLFLAIGHHRETLTAEDFHPFFATPEEAQEAFKHFDADNNGDISKAEMRDAVQRIYRERRALSTSLKDMSSAVSKLDGVLMGIGLIIVVFIWLLIFNGNSTVTNIAPLSTIVVSFSFVFGNSAKTLFESMVFIFATHPYDVGDLVCVDDNFMFVVSFGLISTTFRTVVNEYIVVPNALLSTSKMIFNCRRSGNQWEVTMIQVGYDSTLLEMIDVLRAKLRGYVKSHDREWGGGLEINIDQIESQANSVQLVIAMEHKGNWQDWGARWARRTQLMRHVKMYCEELGIKYSLPLQPVTFHPARGPPPHVPKGPRVPSSTSSPSTSSLPVGGMGKRQYTRAEAAALKKK